MTIQELRNTFLGYFEDRGHLIRPSSPLVLHDDPTSLFTSAGMQPYVPAYRGEVAPPASRVVSCQKCLRTGDIDDVGHYNRYHTFFEMLGNFSFGDYFKVEAIDFGWEFITEVMGLDKDRIWVGVYESDDEAEEIWHKRIGQPMERIRRFGREDNWWPKVRWEGPCGPCTEIHYDLGPEFGCAGGCDFGCSCNRYLELWNLVFQQFTEAENGVLTPLPAPGIDTGMGLERLGLVSQNKEWSMETDELWHILTTALEIINVDRDKPYQYGQDKQLDIALRVIADHIRGVAFVIADNVVPSNEGAGYVIRRLIRRAYRFGRQLGAIGPFLYKALPAVSQAMGQAYPEIIARQDYATRVLQAEEERFDTTLQLGLDLFEEIAEDLEKANTTVIPGELAFRLSDTYGFPVEVTRELATERGLSVDEAGFCEAMQIQRERSRGKAKGLELHEDSSLSSAAGKSVFCGYDTENAAGTVQLIVKDNETAASAIAGEEVGVVLDVTSFYAEKGGQVGDQGLLLADGVKVEVTDTVLLGNAILHTGKVLEGTVKIGDCLQAQVDEARRWDIRRNHTATHLLQAALRQVLGDHVAQSGSLVTPERFRFDFSHHEGVHAPQLREVEDLVNGWILTDYEVCSREMDLEEAKAAGATALFGEKYGDTVRTVNVPQVSFELCGGTHSTRTGQIGFIRLLHEGSVAAGIRRIEGVSGRGALHFTREMDTVLYTAAQDLNCKPGEVAERIDTLHKKIADLNAQLKAAREMSAATNLGDMVKTAQDVSGIKLVVTQIPGADRDALAALTDKIVEQVGECVVLLGTENDGKVILIAKVSDKLISRGAHAGNLVKAVAAVCGGGGGGKPNFAQAGGAQPEKLEEALAGAAGFLAGMLKN